MLFKIIGVLVLLVIVIRAIQSFRVFGIDELREMLDMNESERVAFAKRNHFTEITKAGHSGREFGMKFANDIVYFASDHMAIGETTFVIYRLKPKLAKRFLEKVLLDGYKNENRPDFRNEGLDVSRTSGEQMYFFPWIGQVDASHLYLKGQSGLIHSIISGEDGFEQFLVYSRKKILK